METTTSIWGEIKNDYNRASGETNASGLLAGLGGYFSKEHLTKDLPQGGLDLAWNAPKAAIMSVVQPIRKDLYAGLGTTAESLGTFKLELVKDIIKPVSYTMGHIRHKIFAGLSLTDPLTWWKSAKGIVSLPFATAAGVGSAITHIPGDLLSLPATLFGATAKTIGGVGEHFFASFHTFGKGGLVFSDTIERAINNFLVPPTWRENRDSDYEHISRWGDEFGVSTNS